MARLQIEVSLLAVLLLVVIQLVGVASGVTINCAGSSAVQSILATGITGHASWISSFQTLANNRVTINFNATSSYAGDNSIMTDAVDFAVTEVPLTDAQVHALKAPILHIPVTLTAWEFTYNVPADQISGPLNLTADIVARMFTRQITSWNDPAIVQSNPRLTYSGPITLVVRAEGSGATYAVSQFLSTSSSYWSYGVAPVIAWPEGSTYAKGSAAVAAAVKAAVGAIGYTRFGVAAEAGLPSAMVKNSAGYWTRATQESVLAACLDLSPDFGGFGIPGVGESWESFTLVGQAGHSTYPVVTFAYALVHQNMIGMTDRGAAVLNFLKYVNMAATQEVGPIFSFVPLPLFVRQQNEKAMQTVELAFGYSPFDYYNPHVPKGGNRTAGILSLVLSLLILLGLAGLIVKEIHYRFIQDRASGVY